MGLCIVALPNSAAAAAAGAAAGWREGRVSDRRVKPCDGVDAVSPRWQQLAAAKTDRAGAGQSQRAQGVGGAVTLRAEVTLTAAGTLDKIPGKCAAML